MSSDNSASFFSKSTWRTKVGLAEMLRGGVIMDVKNAEQAKIAEEAGACPVMALERVSLEYGKWDHGKDLAIIA